MSLAHDLLRNIHIVFGALGLLSGAASMSVRKGTLAHARVGTVFFGSMTTMAICGIILSIAPRVDRLNITGGSLTLYLVLTAWITVRRAPAETGRAEVALALLGVTGALIIFGFAWRASRIPAAAGAVPYFAAFGSVMALGVLGDVRSIRRGGLRGRMRTTRHLWRMCTAMLLATLSLFLGQPQLFPTAVRERGLLFAPPIGVMLALLYFLTRERPRRRRGSPSVSPGGIPSRR